MYNYLSNIGFLLGTYFLGFNFMLIASSGIKLYREQTKNNLHMLLTASSLYLFGFWNTLLYAFIYCLSRIMDNYEKILIQFNKIRKEFYEFRTFYENEKKNNPDKIIKEMEMYNNVLSEYCRLTALLQNRLALIADNVYVLAITDYVTNIDYKYYSELINSHISNLIQYLNECVDSNEWLSDVKKRIVSYYDKVNEQYDKYNKDIIVEPNSENKHNLIDSNPMQNSFKNMENLINMDKMMSDFCKDMNISEDEIKKFKPDQQKQPSIDELNKLMMSLGELQKLSGEFNAFNPVPRNMTKSQRKALKRLKKNQ